MTIAVDLAAPQPGIWAAWFRAASSGREARRQLAPWGASAGLHLAVAGAALLAVLVRPPEPPGAPIDAITVDIVMMEPQPLVEEAGTDGAEAAPAPPEAAAPSPDARQQFEVVLPDRPLPEVLTRNEEMSWEGEPTIQLALPSNIRAALATAYYCRSTALGIAAELRRCPPILDRFALTARMAAMDPDAFYDAQFVEAAERLGLSVGGAGVTADGASSARAGAPGPVNGRDPRLSSADEMRDRLPPSSPAPFFGD